MKEIIIDYPQSLRDKITECIFDQMIYGAGRLVVTEEERKFIIEQINRKVKEEPLPDKRLDG